MADLKSVCYFVLNSLIGGIRWAFGDVPAHLTSNLAEVAPRYAELPPAS
jgi:hypothetical protein